MFDLYSDETFTDKCIMVIDFITILTVGAHTSHVAIRCYKQYVLFYLDGLGPGWDCSKNILYVSSSDISVNIVH